MKSQSILYVEDDLAARVSPNNLGHPGMRLEPAEDILTNGIRSRKEEGIHADLRSHQATDYRGDKQVYATRGLFPTFNCILKQSTLQECAGNALLV